MPSRAPRALPSLLWLSRDLRLADNAALAAALARGGPVVPVFLADEVDDAPGWPMGAASRWWLHGALAALDAQLRACGSRLVLRRGTPLEAVLSLVRETGAVAVHWSRRIEPGANAARARMRAALAGAGIAASEHDDGALVAAGSLVNASGEPYRVFTPFFRALLARTACAPPGRAPRRIPAPARWPASEPLAALGLRPSGPDWAAGLAQAWTPGEPAALARLARFARRGAARYALDRDFPGRAGGSRLSAHLHFGEITPRQVWHAVGAPRGRAGAQAFLREIAWREFSRHLLACHPALAEAPLRAPFAAFPWERSAARLRAWQRGRTGYPIVDAGMRELWRTGAMHNRARMIVASFLVKDLLLDWRRGARWFWDTLVDADLASNSANWQWVAGCGVDAAPYFRIFHPARQAARFDGSGDYVRRWVPELAGLPDARLHAPWEASRAELESAGVRLGRTYPRPIVDHARARLRALQAYAQMRAA